MTKPKSMEEYLQEQFMEEYLSNDKDRFQEAFVAWSGSFEIDDWFYYIDKYLKDAGYIHKDEVVFITNGTDKIKKFKASSGVITEYKERIPFTEMRNFTKKEKEQISKQRQKELTKMICIPKSSDKQALIDAIEPIMRRFEKADTGKGFVRSGVAEAMYDDLAQLKEERE